MSQDDLLDEPLNVATTIRTKEKVPIPVVILSVVVLLFLQVIAMWRFLAEEVKVALTQMEISVALLLLILALWQCFFVFRDRADAYLKRYAFLFMSFMVVGVGLGLLDRSEALSTNFLVLDYLVGSIFLNIIYWIIRGLMVSITIRYWARRSNAGSWYRLWYVWCWVGIVFFTLYYEGRKVVSVLVSSWFEAYETFILVYPLLLALALLICYFIHRRNTVQTPLSGWVALLSGGWWCCVHVGVLNLYLAEDVQRDIVFSGTVLFCLLVLVLWWSRYRVSTSSESKTSSVSQ